MIRRLFWPALTTAVAFLILIGLGTWQVQRLHWKEGILAQIARAESGPANPLPADPDAYSKVAVTGRLLNDHPASYGADVRDTPAGPVLGTQLIVPLERNDAEPLLIDRGWVPSARREPIDQPNGEVTIEGYVHPGDKPGLFSATDDKATRQFYTLDPATIGAALGLSHVAPFVLVAIGQASPGHWPIPAQHLPRPPNNHLSYAITWYGLALSLVVIFVLWVRKQT
jgi:surfeit locus 1 family protein